MAHFSENFEYERLTPKWVLLRNDVCFYFTLSEVFGGAIPYLREMMLVTGLDPEQPLHVCAPTGFVTDLASIPTALRGMYSPDGPWAQAAVIHDMVYQSLKENTHYATEMTPIQKLNCFHTRYMADRLFLMGMRELDVGKITRSLMFNAVRAGGASSYGGKPVESDYGLWCCKPAIQSTDMYNIYRDTESQGVSTDLTYLESNRYTHHGLKYPNLKREFIYQTKLCTG